MYTQAAGQGPLQYQASILEPPPYSPPPDQQNHPRYQNLAHTQDAGAQSFSPAKAPGQAPLSIPPYGNGGYPFEKEKNAYQTPNGKPYQQQQCLSQSQSHAPLLTPSCPNAGYSEKMQQPIYTVLPEQLPFPQQEQHLQPPIHPPPTYIPQNFPPPAQVPAQTNFPPPPTSHVVAASGKLKDEQSTKTMKRLMGDSVFGRVIRSTVRTANTAMKMPDALSPWGDNNPVTLPNVRYRDAVLMVACHGIAMPMADGMAAEATSLFGADAFISEVINSTAGSIVTHMTAVMAVRMALDTLGSMTGTEEEKILTTTNIKSLRVQLKHKLMGVDADVRFFGVHPTSDIKSCSKGWFCPYLFASARTPAIPRTNDFAIAQCFGPFLAADYAMAHKLVEESTRILPLCDIDPKADIGTNRMVITFAGLTPYRGGNGMWSTARRPGCAMLHFHLFDGCPALVIPVNAQAPIVAWSPWTLKQMQQGLMVSNQLAREKPEWMVREGIEMPKYEVEQTCEGSQKYDGGSAQSGGYVAEIQHEQICEWLDGLLSVPHLSPEVRGTYVDVLSRGVSMIVNGALCLDSAPKGLLGKIDAERAGIVMFRY
ncbi:hypothetical protein EG327_005161 [Venturia inaequalis]|uniref:Uncharacterized protein n=1 Tax=Venturia inaequalis TaxID=5025 RepID=A0A8H3VTG6_VENIN|nr:hypothetical protein EG327_005161 [Venturia inaequalis]